MSISENYFKKTVLFPWAANWSRGNKNCSCTVVNSVRCCWGDWLWSKHQLSREAKFTVLNCTVSSETSPFIRFTCLVGVICFRYLPKEVIRVSLQEDAAAMAILEGCCFGNKSQAAKANKANHSSVSPGGYYVFSGMIPQAVQWFCFCHSFCGIAAEESKLSLF